MEDWFPNRRIFRARNFDGTPNRVWLSEVNRHLHRYFAPLLGLAALSLFACSKSKTPDLASTTPSPSPAGSTATSTATPAGTLDSFACGLLTKEELQAVQGETVVAATPLPGLGAGFAVSQCYFQLATPVNSVVLTVTRKGEGANAKDPRESWREIFYREAREKKEKEEEGEAKEPERVDGLGDEAFWTGNRVGGALFVLKGNCYIRISVGGAGDQAAKIEKSKKLAESVLKRLP